MRNLRLVRFAMFLVSLPLSMAFYTDRCLAQGSGAIIAGPGATVVVLPAQANLNPNNNGLIVAPPGSIVVVPAQPQKGTGGTSSPIAVKVQMRADYRKIVVYQALPLVGASTFISLLASPLGQGPFLATSALLAATTISPVEGDAWTAASLNGSPALLRFTTGNLAIKISNIVLIVFDDALDLAKADSTPATVTYLSDDGKALRQFRGVPQSLAQLGLGIDKGTGAIQLISPADVKAISFKQ